METRQIHVKNLSTVTGIQQYEHEVQSIYFLGLEDFVGTIYLSIESDDYSNEAIPLTSNTFIIGQPMTKFNTTYTCQIYGVLNDGEKIQLSKRFRLIVDKSNDIQGDSEEYPVDPNFTNGIIEFMNEQKEQAQSEIEATGQSVIQSIPSDYTELESRVDELEQGTGGAINARAKQTLLELFTNAYYRGDYDPATAISILDTALDTIVDNNWYITNHLTECTTSNDTGSVRKNSSYTATITPSEGYSITQSDATLTVTMGGVDITSTAWDESTKTISIGTVTGDIVITAIAVEKVVEYVLHQPAQATSLLSFGTTYKSGVVKKIEFTVEYPTQASGLKVWTKEFSGGWIGINNGEWAYGGGRNATMSHTPSEITNAGKVVVTFTATTITGSGGNEIKTGWGTSSNQLSSNPEFYWYRIRFFDANDNVLRDLKPTANVGEFYDSVVGDTLVIANAESAGYTVAEVSE